MFGMKKFPRPIGHAAVALSMLIAVLSISLHAQTPAGADSLRADAKGKTAAAIVPDSREPLLIENTQLRDSLATMTHRVEQASIAGPKNTAQFKWAARVAFVCVLLWLALVVIYYAWAIRRYNVNYGLTDEEWKIFHPEIYAKDNEQQKYFAKRDTMMQNMVQLAGLKAPDGAPIASPSKIPAEAEAAGVQLFQSGGAIPAVPGIPGSPAPSASAAPADNSSGASALLTPPGAVGDAASRFLYDIPKDNPYKDESFGLPPGTLRGTLALTAMVVVVLVEGVNFYSASSLELHYSEFISVFKIIIAFYFGSRFLESMSKSKTDGLAGKITNLGAVDSGDEAAPKPAPAPAAIAPAARTTLAYEARVAPAAPVVPETPTTSDAVKAMDKQLELPAEKPAVMLGLADIRVPNIQANLASQPATATATAAPGQTGAPPVAQAPTALSDDSPVKLKILSLTSSFETGLRFPDCFGAVAGNFDGQGLSFGALQWNLGQDTLQPLLKKLFQKNEDEAKKILGDDLFSDFTNILSRPVAEQLEWIKKFQISVQNPQTGVRRVVLDPKLLNPLRQLGKTDAFIQIQLEEVETRFMKAANNCELYGLTTQRGLALMFDINVQNGLVDKDGAGAKIRRDYDTLDANMPEAELQTAKMKIIATRRSEVVSAAWRQDVLTRKMTIATGTGEVHKRTYDLARDFKIGLDRYVV